MLENFFIGIGNSINAMVEGFSDKHSAQIDSFDAFLQANPLQMEWALGGLFVLTVFILKCIEMDRNREYVNDEETLELEEDLEEVTESTPIRNLNLSNARPSPRSGFKEEL